MKRVVALLIAVVLCALFCGCGKDSDQKKATTDEAVAATMATQEEAQKPTKAAKKTSKKDNANTAKAEDYIKLYQDTDHVHNLGNADKPKLMPLLTIKSSDAEAFNKKMTEKYDTFIGYMEKNGSGQTPDRDNSYYYDAVINDRILSLCVYYDTPMIDRFDTINIDIDTGKEIDTDALLASCGTSYDAVKEQLKTIVTVYYIRNLNYDPDSGKKNEMYDKAVSDESLSNMPFVLGTKKKLYGIFTWYYEVQAGSGQWKEAVSV